LAVERCPPARIASGRFLTAGCFRGWRSSSITAVRARHTPSRAGAPSVVVPFAADQFFWADRLCRLGRAAAVLPQRAIDVARSLAAETGVANAVARIEALVAPRLMR